jgi:integrase
LPRNGSSRPQLRRKDMLGRQAKTISQPTLRRMLAYARRTRTPMRDQVIVLLSVKAGLRACEIAALEWSMVLDASGTVGDLIEIRTAIAKYQSGRRIPMHPQLKEALTRLLREQRSADGPVIVSTVAGACAPTASSTGLSRRLPN